MASPRTRITTLNLGSQSIELAEFRILPRGELILQGYRSREILSDPAAEGTRQTKIVLPLREMLGDLRIKGGPVNYTVAEESIFTRFVDLPSVDPKKIERVVFFEAQQNVPFPIDEVVWDYQLVAGGVAEQIQVILVAIKADLLEEINHAVESTGLRTSIVDLATMALSNAFRHNYPELDGCSLLVDIGARTTNLIFLEPERVFTRSVPIGGSSVTSAIAKEFNETFAAAEVRKKRDGFVGRKENETEGLEPAIARVSKIVRTTMTRLHAEVVRSINHYCSQQQGRPPERVFLSGGTASTPYLDEFFRDRLQLPVEFFNALRRVSVHQSAGLDDIAQSAHLLGEPVGLALRTAIHCPMELNLLPKVVLRRQELEKQRPFFVTAAACFLLGLLGWGAYFWRAGQVMERTTARLEEKVDAMKRVEAQMNQARKQIVSLDHLSAPLAAAINDRSFWLQIIEELNARLPKEDIWITELVPTSDGKPLGAPDPRTGRAAATPIPPTSASRSGVAAQPAIEGLLVRGLYLFNPKQQEVVVDYFRNLVESPWFAIDAKNQAKVIKPTTPNNTEWAFPYELWLDLRKPVPLP